MRGLQGKVGVIAGGARGIGAATARRLAEEGASVVIGDMLVELAEQVAADIRASGGKAIAVALDGTDAASQAAFVKAALDEFGGLDLYHSNLAGGTEGDIDALNCLIEVLGAAAGGAAWQVAYPMTKNAIHALARHVAQKWGKQGIRANVICPGLVLTEAAEAHLTDEYRAAGLKAVPHTRLGKPEDIAAAVTFLASEDGEWVNGQVWHVNGGTLKRD